MLNSEFGFQIKLMIGLTKTFYHGNSTDFFLIVNKYLCRYINIYRLFY